MVKMRSEAPRISRGLFIYLQKNMKIAQVIFASECMGGLWPEHLEQFTQVKEWWQEMKSKSARSARSEYHTYWWPLSLCFYSNRPWFVIPTSNWSAYLGDVCKALKVLTWRHLNWYAIPYFAEREHPLLKINASPPQFFTDIQMSSTKGLWFNEITRSWYEMN